MQPVPQCPTLARLAEEGVVRARFEDEEQLYTGMKNLLGYLVVERGSSRLWHRGRTYPVRPGDLVLFEPGEVYRDEARDGTSSYEIVLFDDAQVKLLNWVGRSSPVLAANDARAQPLWALRARLRTADSALERSNAVAEAVQAWSAAPTCERRERGERLTVARARAYLREHMLEHVRLDDLADHVRSDKYHLIRAFRAEVGVPPYEYLTQLRMLRARELLREGLQASQVASALGYCDQSQFHRHFVRLVGSTPGAFACATANKFSAQARLVAPERARSTLHPERIARLGF